MQTVERAKKFFAAPATACAVLLAVAAIRWTAVRGDRKAAAVPPETGGIEVTDEEVRAEILHVMGDPEEFLRTDNEIQRRLPKALRKARAEPERANEIYATEFAGTGLSEFLPKSLWEEQLAAFTEKQIAAMEAWRPMDASDLAGFEDDIRAFLVEKKRREAEAASAACRGE